MDLMDYRKRLGIGFNDSKKQEYFANRMINTLRNIPLTSSVFLDNAEYVKFCNSVGAKAELAFTNKYWEFAVRWIESKREDAKEFLFAAVAFAHCLSIKRQTDMMMAIIEGNLQAAQIGYEIIQDDDGSFIFPKGAAELDVALVSEPLEWLFAYPKSKTAFIKALKQYGEATEDTASDVADAFRKALECFFQEFFGGEKNLENYKSEYGKYLKESGIPAEISNGFEKLLNLYTDFMNNYAKHHDKTGLNVLEYIMYQTGNTVRFLIILKNT